MRIEIPLEDILAKVRQHHVGIVIGCGVIARVTEYLRNRGYWLDEGSLAGVIQNTTWGGFFRPLAHGQLAPVGFLALERLALQVLGDRQLVLRLLPLLGGLISLWLLRVIASRSLTPRAALLVVGMFAFSDELIYFSSELKPYSTDVTVSLVCLLMGQQYLAAETSSVRRLVILALAPWFSFPSVFMLAGVGLVLFVSAGSKRKLREMLELAGIGTISLEDPEGRITLATPPDKHIDCALDSMLGQKFWRSETRLFLQVIGNNRLPRMEGEAGRRLNIRPK